MGLDMYAYTTHTVVSQDVDFDVEESEAEMLHQWRKHPNLHGMMRALYTWKGGTNRDFNCSNVALKLDDLSVIEEAILKNELPETAGFFFGSSDGSEQVDDLWFIEKARNALNSGLVVFYRAWW